VVIFGFAIEDELPATPLLFAIVGGDEGLEPPTPPDPIVIV
jgi:hypothetical protein